MGGIYIHIPYCKQACHYCDFHFSTQLNGIETMIWSIEQEIDQRSHEIPVPLRTLYFGGGTPSLVHPELLGKLVESIHGKQSTSTIQEITLECNPDDISKERLQAWADLGITRLSLGVQSLIDDHLLWMNRSHSADQAFRALEWIANSAIKEVTVDVIYGFTGLNLHQLQSTLTDLVAFPIQHLSAYALTIEPKTVLNHHLKKNLYTSMPDAEVVHQQYFIRSFLLERGWEHYEISNFCKPGFEAKHNSQYWSFSPYMGVGPAAHSFDGRKRRWNLAHNPGYIQAIQQGTVFHDEETLSSTDLFNEYIMVSLRRMMGIARQDLIDRFPEYLDHFNTTLQIALSDQLLEEEGDYVRLSEKGLCLADRIASDFFIT